MSDRRSWSSVVALVVSIAVGACGGDSGRTSGPSAQRGEIVGNEDQPQRIILHASDPDGDALTFQIERPPQHGALTGQGPDIIYTPVADFHGEDSLAFSVSDGITSSNIAEVSVRVRPANDAPVAMAQTVAVIEDTAQTIALETVDVDGDALTFETTPPEHGVLSGQGASLIYKPAADFHGEDHFSFVARDRTASSASAIVTIHVASIEDAPRAAPSTVSLQEDVAQAIVLDAADPDGDPIHLEIMQPPAHGTLTGTEPPLTYTPAVNYSGTDAFTYRISAGGLTSAPATVTLQIAPVNDAPVASGGAVETFEDTAVSFELSASDVDGQPLTYSIDSASGASQASIAGTTLTYHPAPNITGPHPIRFRASDGALSSTATVIVTMLPVNDAPTALDDFAATDPATPLALDVMRNDSDVDGDAFVFEAAGSPAHGRVESRGDGVVVYTPDAGFTGVDTFRYSIRDTHGSAGTGEAHVGVGTFPLGVPTEALAEFSSTTDAADNQPALSDDGRYIAIATATDLVDDDCNDMQDVYLFDRGTRAVTRISVPADGGDADGDSWWPRISGDGRYIVFESAATNLIDGDTNGKRDVFRHDRATGVTIRVSVTDGGDQGISHSEDPAISDDGNLIAFVSDAPGLVADDTNPVADIFLRDVAAGTTTRVNLRDVGGQANGGAIEPSLSGDGRFVAFTSAANDLVAGDTNNAADVFVRDRLAGTTTRVSVSSAGVEANQAARRASISRDGQTIAFLSNATNLFPNVTERFQVYVRDLRTQRTSHPLPVNRPMRSAQLSSDGRYLAAHSTFLNVGVIIFDRIAGVAFPEAFTSTWSLPGFSGNGRYLAVLARRLFELDGTLTAMPNPL